jgi:beta-aspartyl-peptidase (threonine type)
MAEAPVAIVVHGGAWDIPEPYHAAHVAGTHGAATAGWAILAAGGSALDALEVALRLMEDDPTFDAGRGSVLTAAGTVELDAGLMDGNSLKIGAVAAVQSYANPISIARRVLEQTDHHLLVGPGAEAFAATQGFAAIDNRMLIVEREQTLYEEFRSGQRALTDDFGVHDTVGAVVLDRSGRLVAGNSTGGVSFSLPGRVGDAPLPGVGFYADSRWGAVACTGWGEQIMRAGLALRVMQQLEDGATAQQAATFAIRLLQERVRGRAGVIVLDRFGRVGVAHSTAQMPYAYCTLDDPVVRGGIGV